LDDVVIQSGAQAGGLLCDGLGDGVMIEHPEV
jgi:(E)-4-hydroxy-3-methylbut-2-enyl-diphosphate synthase